MLSTHVLYNLLDLREQIDELDIGGEEEASRGGGAEVELGMEEVELHLGATWPKKKNRL